MSVTLLLYPQEDYELISALTSFCKREGFTLTVEEVNVLAQDTGFLLYTVKGNHVYGQRKKIPGYDYYVPFTLLTSGREQSAVTGLLSLFYGIGVVSASASERSSYYFADGVTPFVVRRDSYVLYQEACQELLGFKVVTTSPIMETVLKVYPETSIKRFRNYSLWYCDPRFNPEASLARLQQVVQAGYFVAPAVSSVALAKFGYQRLGVEPPFTAYHSFASNLVRGPLVAGSRLEAIDLQTISDAYKAGTLPLLEVKLDYFVSRSILAGFHFAYLDYLQAKEGKFITSLSCQQLLATTAYTLSGEESSWLRICVPDLSTLNYLLTAAPKRATELTLTQASSKELALAYRVLLSARGYASLLLEDEVGFFIAVDNYLGPALANLGPTNEVKEAELEAKAAKLANYKTSGESYAYSGIYTVPGLAGILENIPVYNREVIKQERKEYGYEIYDRTGMLLTTLVVSDTQVLDVNKIYARYQREYGEIRVASWEKKYLSAESTSSPSL